MRHKKRKAQYREPSAMRSWFELAVTVGPFVALWALAWWSLSVSAWLTLAISIVNGMFLVRLFCIQHDCGHAAFFENRTVSDWTGRVLGVLTLTPYDVWKRTHSMHHSASGNLDRRGMGDVHTLTVAEYNALPPMRRLLYRMYRNPIVLFGLGPAYLFFLQNRVPLGLMDKAKYWVRRQLALCAAQAVAVAERQYRHPPCAPPLQPHSVLSLARSASGSCNARGYEPDDNP